VDAAAGMKLRDVAAFVCFLRRVSCIKDGGGSRKVQGCQREGCRWLTVADLWWLPAW